MRSARGSVLLLLAAVLPISLYAQVSSGNTDNDPTTALVARLSTDVPAVGTGTLATVSYTHLDVYKRQPKTQPSPHPPASHVLSKVALLSTAEGFSVRPLSEMKS